MPIITHLKPQKNQKRVNVYVDGDFAFGIDLDNLVRFGINIEKEFSTEELNKIIHEAEFQKTFDKLLSFAMTRPRSYKEINDWFRRKKVPQELYSKLIQRLEKLELLDDAKFAKWWVEQRLEFKKTGPKLLKLELQQKGISREIVDEVLNKEDINEEKLAQELLAKKTSKWTRYDDETKKRKQTEFLLRNGFQWGVVEKVVSTKKNR